MPLTLRKRGQYYHARGTVPIRAEDGSIQRERIEESTRCSKKSDAREVADAIERGYFDRAYRPVHAKGIPFAEAALTYMQTSGNTRYMAPLIEYFGMDSLLDIDQDAALRAADKLYPDCLPSTINRQVFTPLIAVKRMAAENGKAPGPSLKRPKGHDTLPELEIPNNDWFDQVLPHCNPRIAALILTISITGRRVTELTGIRSKSVDVITRKAPIGRTKNGEPILLRIPDAAFEAIDDWKSRERFFGYSSRHSVNNALKRACARAGADVYSSHKVGRHSFATRILGEGHSLKFLKEAGGWKSIAMPARRYGHLERSEIDETVHKLGQKWGSGRAKPAKVSKK